MGAPKQAIRHVCEGASIPVLRRHHLTFRGPSRNPTLTLALSLRERVAPGEKSPARPRDLIRPISPLRPIGRMRNPRRLGRPRASVQCQSAAAALILFAPHPGVRFSAEDLRRCT
jgi:hypothetical protein